MTRAETTSTTRRDFSKWMAAAGAAVAVPVIGSAGQAHEVAADPIFAALAAHEKADNALGDAYSNLEAVERELKRAGDLEPSVESVGNPGNGLPPIRSTSHDKIDLYTPADMHPDRNRNEHAALSAAIARRDARRKPVLEAVSAAEDIEIKARYTVDEIEPTTLEGALAALKFTRKYTL